jgi:endonuclease/exonuclease/phosphatase family metal-dependent hydrolase
MGDFNMRTAEDMDAETALQDGIGWIDAWKASPPGPIKYASKFTWDSFINKYHEDGFQYRARYDRCYYRGEDIVRVNKFDLIGNVPVHNRPGDYLSDHFGMLVELSVKLQETNTKVKGNEEENDVDESDDEVELVGIMKGGVLSK